MWRAFSLVLFISRFQKDIEIIWALLRGLALAALAKLTSWQNVTLTIFYLY